MKELTPEDLLDPNFDMNKWILDKVSEYVKLQLEEDDKVWEYDILYGEGAYEKLIYGGGAGL